jgi:hypothetical protein
MLLFVENALCSRAVMPKYVLLVILFNSEMNVCHIK